MDTAEVVNLTCTFDASTIYSPTEKGFVRRFENNGDTPEHYFYASANYAAPEHGGTHTDAPRHFNRNGTTLDQVPLADCIGPAAVIDFSARAANDPDAMLTVDDIEAYGSRQRSDSRRCDRRRALGMGQILSRQETLHGHRQAGRRCGPAFSRLFGGGGGFLFEESSRRGNRDRYREHGSGNSKDFPVHRLWLGANKPGFENIANAENCPPRARRYFASR